MTGTERWEDANASERLERLRNERQEARLAWLGWFFTGLAVIAVIGGLMFVVSWNTQQDREQRERQMHECVTVGRIWINGNCIPSGVSR
jgi:hypothetical protein